jgi:hypothetical protein
MTDISMTRDFISFLGINCSASPTHIAVGCRFLLRLLHIFTFDISMKRFQAFLGDDDLV